MTGPQRSSVNRRRRRHRSDAPFDLWRTPSPLPEVVPVATGVDVSALLRSLGDPPLRNGAAGGHYFDAVVERAAAMAAALAFSVDLLIDPDGS